MFCFCNKYFSPIYWIDGSIKLGPVAAMAVVGASPAIILAMVLSQADFMDEPFIILITWFVGSCLAFICWKLGREWTTQSQKETAVGTFNGGYFSSMAMSRSFFNRFFTAVGVGGALVVLCAFFLDLVGAYFWGILVITTQMLLNENGLTVYRGRVSPQDANLHQHPSNIYITGFRGVASAPTAIFLAVSISVRFGNWLASDTEFMAPNAALALAWLVG